MKNDVKSTAQDKMLVTGLAKKRSDLRGIVRFIAQRAAERRWSAMQRKNVTAPQQQQGDSP